MNWILPANGKLYDHAGAFQKWGFIDWRQNNRKCQVGDIIYIYCTRPYKKIMYKTIVEQINLTVNEIVNDYIFWTDKNEYYKALSGMYVRLKLLEQVNTQYLTLENLMNNGLSSAPQSSIKISNEKLLAYIEKYMNDNYYRDTFPDSDETDNCVEGAKTTVCVNRFERSSIARQKCIESNGCYCHVCGLNFEEKYGAIGKDFIHVHHKIPLSEISEEYIVDPVNDLIPVCPNCHAMLLRKINDKYLNIEKLKSVIK